MNPGLRLHEDKSGEPVDETEYKKMVGCLRYLLHTRPDMAFSVGVVSRFMKRPTVMHMQAIKQILRYLKGTTEMGLVYTQHGGEEVLVGYTDSDHSGDPVGRKSISGMAFYLNGNLITWCSQKMRTVVVSSCESEFMSATAGAMQAIWLRGLLSELTSTETKVVPLYVDNSAIALMKNPVFHGKSKHIDTRFHFIRQCIEREQIVARRVGTTEQKVDSLTKALSAGSLMVMRHLLGVRDLSVLQG
jgi:hypothetical protein